MFQAPVKWTRARTAFKLLEVMYHNIVHDVSKLHRNAVVGLMLNMLQAVIFVITFYAMFAILGIRGAELRGDFLLYIMSGIFPFLTHTKSLAQRGRRPLLIQHAPMNRAISNTSAAVSSHYLQVLSFVVILSIYHVGFKPVHIEDPIGAFGMLLLA